jgi:hypothetical protein
MSRWSVSIIRKKAEYLGVVTAPATRQECRQSRFEPAQSAGSFASSRPAN